MFDIDEFVERIMAFHDLPNTVTPEFLGHVIGLASDLATLAVMKANKNTEDATHGTLAASAAVIGALRILAAVVGKLPSSLEDQGHFHGSDIDHMISNDTLMFASILVPTMFNHDSNSGNNGIACNWGNNVVKTAINRFVKLMETDIKPKLAPGLTVLATLPGADDPIVPSDGRMLN